MIQHRIVLLTIILAFVVSKLGLPASATENASPLVIGETFTIDSKIMGETRRINVYIPPAYPQHRAQGFLCCTCRTAVWLRISCISRVWYRSLSATERCEPFLLVGIENTERRRDMTGPTENAEDKKIAPRVGGSETFRAFIRQELMPQVKARYRTTNETAIVGESASRVVRCGNVPSRSGSVRYLHSLRSKPLVEQSKTRQRRSGASAAESSRKRRCISLTVTRRRCSTSREGLRLF